MNYYCELSMPMVQAMTQMRINLLSFKYLLLLCTVSIGLL